MVSLKAIFWSIFGSAAVKGLPNLHGRAGDVSTPIGVAKGVMNSGNTAMRFPVKYAQAARWKDSQVATAWQLPNNSSDPSAIPLRCPQSGSSSYSEDCLSMMLYVPTTLKASSSVPVFMWVHGGSFIVGGANADGLDGSALAVATNSIVAVVQYRLGALGFMAPDGSTNLAVKDVMNAMKFVQNVASSFGGSKSDITLAGQSSGANMIRALLATPSASSLFSKAIIQSDPMNYGFLSTSTQATMQSYFNDAVHCTSGDSACLNSLSLDTILDAQADLVDDASSLDAAAGAAQPIRPVRNGNLITSPLDSTASFPSVSKPVLLTTVLNEAGPTIYGGFSAALTSDYFAYVSQASLGDERTSTVVASKYYDIAASDARTPLQVLGTDYMWKCSTWTFARNWVKSGGKAYVGVHTVGSTYSSNSGVGFCTEAGKVCHEDDIKIVFGTVQSPSTTQKAAISDIQKRYKAFMTSGNPNASGLPTWSAAGSSDVKPFSLGGTTTSSKVDVGACVPEFWGSAAQYDYQVYGI